MLEKIAEIVDQLTVLIRIVLKDGTVTDWSSWLSFPSEGYGEIMRYGPFLIRDVKFIEINAIERRTLGKLLPQKEIDHGKELEDALNDFGVDFKKNGDILKISL